MSNILFIAPIFFGYEKTIKAKLEAAYDRVFFRCEVPFQSPVRFFALRRLSHKLAQVALESYNERLVKLVVEQKVDKVFIIRGYGLLPRFFEKIIEHNPSIQIVNYQWDSVQNNPNGLMISKYAHKNFSFDLIDVEHYPQFVHIPLFYTWDSVADADAIRKSSKQDIDLLFVGGYHSGRHKIVEQVRQQCANKGIVFFSHIYYPIGSYLRDRLTTRTINRKDISFRKVPRVEYYGLLCRSKAMLDIQSNTQTGATIRTIETLSMGRKLVSTNVTLEREQFYSPDNIEIWQTDKPLKIEEILTHSFDHSKDGFITNIDQWLIKIGVINP